MRRVLLLILLSACGRFGFDTRGTDALAGDDALGPHVMPNQLGVHLLADRTSWAPGAPIVGATVIKTEDGVAQQAATDADGRVVFTVAAPADVETGYIDGTGGVITYTVSAAPTGTILELGNRGSGSDAGMTFTLPADGASSSYFVTLPSDCTASTLYSTTPETFAPFRADCVGRTVHVIAVSLSGTSSFIDLGEVALVDGSTFDASSHAWAVLGARSLEVKNLPDNATQVRLDPLVASGSTYLAVGPAAQTPVSGGPTFLSASLDVYTGVATNVLVTASAGLFATITNEPLTDTLDASEMLPIVAEPTYSRGLVAWVAAPSNATLTLVETVYGTNPMHRWTAVLPASATRATFPAALGFPVPPDVVTTPVVARWAVAPYEQVVSTATTELRVVGPSLVPRPGTAVTYSYITGHF